MELNKSIFFEKYNVTTGDLETYLSEALSRGGDYADLYFEYRINHSIVLEEQIIKSANKGVSLGVGVRVVSGEKTGYAYSEDLNRENILYSIPVFPAELEIAQKIVLLRQADEAARAYDPRIKQVQASYVDETKHVLIASSDGRCVWDVQPLVRMNVLCVAEENGQRQSGYQGAGGRRSIDIFSGALEPTALAREAARQAILHL